MLVCAPLVEVQAARAQEASQPRAVTPTAAPQQRVVPNGGAGAGEDRLQALVAELLRLNDRLAALERMTVQVVSRQENESRSLSQLRDEIGRHRADIERQLAGIATASVQPERRAPPVAPVGETASSAPAIDRFEQGKSFANAKDWPRAELALTTFISSYPNDARNAEARYRLGLVYLEQRQPAQGARIFIDLFDTNAAVGFEPENLFALARALREMKDVDLVQVCSVYTEIEVSYGARLSKAMREELLDLRLAGNCRS